MPPTFLTAHYKEREQVKALGARWDGVARKWFVPDGMDLGPFEKWLTSDANVPPSFQTTSEVRPITTAQPQEVGFTNRGISLSALLTGVSQTVAQAYPSGVWTKVEVVKLDARRGHIYLELAERTSQGNAIAQTRAVIWAKTANTIIPAFERATGAVLSSGIKLLVRAKPTFHEQYGFSLAIEDIDPDFTLGDLEAKKREIRARLQQEGLFDANRALPQPWNYTHVFVVAPQGAAGLGDFEAEARRLDAFGICSFTYAFSRFQGDGAAAEIRVAMLHGLSNLRNKLGIIPDAVAIIRGGGAVNDLAWLNEYDLARSICEAGLPVLTGIGHERDSTVLDEVANITFDTPSKVILGIEQVIRKRTTDAQAHFENVVQLSERAINDARKDIEQVHTEVKSAANRTLASAQQSTSEMLSEVRLSAFQSIGRTADAARESFLNIKHQAGEQLADTKERLPELLTEVRINAKQTLRAAREGTSSAFTDVLERTAVQTRDASTSIERGVADVAMGAKRTVSDTATRSEALMREIAGQGPEKTLERGFAIIRDADGNTITSSKNVQQHINIELQFRDGKVRAKTS